MPTLRAVALALSLAALPSAVRAQPRPTDAGQDGVRQAETILAAGMALYHQGDFAGALAKFQAAYQTYPSHKILFNIGEAERRLGQSVQAVNAYATFLALTQDAPDIRTQRALAEKHLAQMRRGLATLQISVDPPGARVEVDGQRVPLLQVYVASGTHTVRASADGYGTATQQVTVAGDDNRPIRFELQPLPKLTPPPPPKPAPVLVLAPPPPPPSHAAGWVLIGVGGACLVASAVFGGLAASSNSALSGAVLQGQPLADSSITLQGLRDQVRTRAWVSTASLGAGIISAGVGAFLLLRRHKAPVMPTAAAGRPALSFNF